MHFEIDPLAVGILLGCLLLIGLLKRTLFFNGASPSFAFSRLDDLKHPNWRSQLAAYPRKLHFAALLLLMAAFIDPHFLWLKSPLTHQKQRPIHELPTEGIAIYLALDISGSMAEPVQAVDDNGATQSIPKIDLLKRVTKQFIYDHPSDLIGIAAFARVPRILVPLTLDQEALLKALNHVQVVKNPQDDGTAMGYAIFKTTNLIAATRHFANDLRQGGSPPYTIKSAIIIVVTDGFQDPSRLDYGNRLRTLELDDAAAYAKSQGIRLYVVNIDPVLGSAQYAPQRRQLQAITSLTGGKFYLVDDTHDLQNIYADIGHLEKGTITRQASLQGQNAQLAYTRFSLYPFLIVLALCCLAASLIMESAILRKVP